MKNIIHNVSHYGIVSSKKQDFTHFAGFVYIFDSVTIINYYLIATLMP